MFSTILPFIELRGAIPLALALGFSPIEALLITVPANSILFIPIYLGCAVIIASRMRGFENLVHEASHYIQVKSERAVSKRIQARGLYLGVGPWGS